MTKTNKFIQFYLVLYFFNFRPLGHFGLVGCVNSSAAEYIEFAKNLSEYLSAPLNEHTVMLSSLDWVPKMHLTNLTRDV